MKADDQKNWRRIYMHYMKADFIWGPYLADINLRL